MNFFRVAFLGFALTEAIRLIRSYDGIPYFICPLILCFMETVCGLTLLPSVKGSIGSIPVAVVFFCLDFSLL